MAKPRIILLLTLSNLIAACSTPYDSSLPTSDSANISFSSMSDKVPEISIKLRGKVYSIDANLIEKRKSTPSIKNVVHIPANEQITLRYETLQITNISYTPVIKSHVSANHLSGPSLDYQLDFEEQHTINTCSDNITFSAGKNKNYAAFVEQVNGRICRIFLSEI